MGDQFLGFIPTIPDGYVMPEGYELEGVCGEDFDGKRRTVYYWFQNRPGDEARFGPDVADKRKAIRQAWRDFRSGGTDPSAVGEPW